ncbi:MAG: MauE/DoxX family redox-associated membrane protein [Candidatus Kapaibacterium sp.]|jgi:uncharacterized membrane protein YphA (DoxX/SURF4 family)
MKKIIENPYLLLIARLVLGFIFVSYGMGKISDPGKFAEEISYYALMPEFTLNILAIILPWIELVTGLLILLGVRLKSGSFLAGALMLIFSLAVIWAIAMGLDINCGCSSTNPQKVGLPKLLENIGLLALSLLIFINPIRKFSLESFVEK